MSLRQLLNNGLQIEGKANDLVIFQNDKLKLHFTAGPEDNSLYYLLGLEKVEKKHNTIIVISTDLAHKRFTHFSEKVLYKFLLATIGFLVVNR
jgi:hypothetical protein